MMSLSALQILKKEEIGSEQISQTCAQIKRKESYFYK